MSYAYSKLKDITTIKTGKLDSNAAVANGIYPFFTCDPNTLRINAWAYDTEAVLLAGNNASGNYTAKYYYGQFNAYQRTYIIESVDKEKLNVRYLQYAMNQQLKLLKVMSAGSTTKFLKLGMLHNLEIPFPDIETQRRIASILSAYDDLIENNQKQIKLLEEAAQRLYKEWFVDLRFPGWENAKIVDGVPEGWELKQICSIADIKAGGDKPEIVNKDKSENTPIPIYANGIEKDGLYGYTTKPVIEKESVTISARGTVGFVFLRRTPYVPIVRLLSVIPHSIPAIYMYYSLKNETFERNGTSQQQITVPMVKNKELLIADISVVDKFTLKVTEYHDKIDILKTQIELLTEARDRLLPKLMSGELEV